MKRRDFISCITVISFDECGNLLKEVRVRYVGFGSEEDEWINIKKAIRERSIPIEHSECGKVKVGDLVLCFQVITLFLSYGLISPMWR